MPELPEVETVVRDLREPLVGRRITGVKVSRKRFRRALSSGWKKCVVGCRVRSVERRGKWILIDLDGPVLLVHLGMTGQFTVVSTETPAKNHTHFVFALVGGDQELRFRDVRRFGSVSYFAARDQALRFFELARLGPEPFQVDARYWKERVIQTKRSLKAMLLDQRLVSGVGNIYADESLFEARLHPTLRGEQLTPRQAERLRLAVETVLTRAIELRGSTIRDYIGGSGLEGGFQTEFAVYGRTGEPCLRCETPIAHMRLAGRSTHYCPRCQKRA